MNYDSLWFDPPAPLILAGVKNPSTGEYRNVPMLLDTGADVTVVPAHIVKELGVSPNPEDTFETIGYDGKIHREPAARLEISVLEHTFRGLFSCDRRELGNRRSKPTQPICSVARWPAATVE